MILIPITIAISLIVEPRELLEEPVGGVESRNNPFNEIRLNEKISSITKASSKVYKLKMYQVVILDLINAR